MRRRFLSSSVLLAIVIGAASGSAAATSAGERAHVATRRAAAVYAAVIRQLVTIDHTFGQTDPGFDVLYLINGPVEDAADPMQPISELEPARPFAPRLIDRLRRKINDLPPLEMVDNRDEVVEGAAPGHVIDNGVLVTLGPIPRGKNRVEVGANLWINGLAGQWLTYVVERQGGRWKVTGTTGPVAIS